MEYTRLKENIDYLKAGVEKLEEKINILIKTVAELKNEVRYMKNNKEQNDLNKAIDQITQQFANIQTTPKQKTNTNYLIYNVEQYKKQLEKTTASNSNNTDTEK